MVGVGVGVDLSTFPKDIDSKGIGELKTLAIESGFSESKVIKNEAKLKKSVR